MGIKQPPSPPLFILFQSTVLFFSAGGREKLFSATERCFEQVLSPETRCSQFRAVGKPRCPCIRLPPFQYHTAWYNSCSRRPIPSYNRHDFTGAVFLRQHHMHLPAVRRKGNLVQRQHPGNSTVMFSSIAKCILFLSPGPHFLSIFHSQEPHDALSCLPYKSTHA